MTAPPPKHGLSHPRRQHPFFSVCRTVGIPRREEGEIQELTLVHKFWSRFPAHHIFPTFLPSIEFQLLSFENPFVPVALLTFSLLTFVLLSSSSRNVFFLHSFPRNEHEKEGRRGMPVVLLFPGHPERTLSNHPPISLLSSWSCFLSLPSSTFEA